ncbi:MAG: zinc-dependent metalloprotease [Candidatus Nanopelagicaceae bacterium]|nr:zinc-dependent metalloprotease [Candidatus Nanopelagicaceae bacterium]
MSIPGGGFGAGDFGDMGSFDFAKMGEALSRLGRAISANATGEGISPDAVREMATLTNDKAPTVNEISSGLEALAVAQLWLDPKTDFTAPVAPAQIWSRSQWIDETLVGWCEIVAPLAESLSSAVSGAISGLTKEALGDAFGDLLGDSLSDEQGGIQGDVSGNQNSNPFSSFGFGPPLNSENAKNDDSKINPNAGNPMAGIFNQMSNAMRAFGGVIFATQLGETIKTTAGSVTGGADIGIPLLTNNRPALIATNCNAWGAELGIPEAELRYYLALREVAGVRLFNNVPWLREYIITAIKSYSAGIKVNIQKIQEGMSGMSVEGIGTSPEALNEAIANGLFTTDETPAQKSAILRLETIAALVEGWVDEVSASAALEHLPALPALRESARRGRATGGPMQKAFAALIGLEISPRASRDAATFFNYIATNESISQRDELWSSPESLPTIEEIINPSAFRKGRSAPDDLSTL